MEQRSHWKIEDWMSVEPVTIQSEQTIGQALELMLLKDVRHLPVLDEDRLIGIVSDRDIGQVMGKGAIAFDERGDTERYLKKPIRAVMTSDPYTVGANTALEEGLETMLKHKIGALPVVERERLIGIFTEFDAIRCCLSLSERHPGGDGVRP